jgi:hypothetical protein
MWSEEEGRRYASQASDLSRPPPRAFPEPNVPGSGGGSLPGGRYMTDHYYTQVQVQVIQQTSSYQRPPPPPPSQFPVPYPTSGNASCLEPQLAMGYVNYRTRPPAALPQVQAHAPEHPPRYFDGGFVTSGRPYPPGPSYGDRGPSYPSHAPERTHPQVPNPPAWPSPTRNLSLVTGSIR